MMIETLKSKISYPLPKIGMRNMKSAFGVIICFLVWQAIRLILPNMEFHPLYAYVSVVLAMRDTTENSIAYGKIRVKGTLIGLLIALISISVIVQASFYLHNEYIRIILEVFIIAVGIILSLYLSCILKCENLCAIATVVFLVCMIRYSTENRYVYALFRTLETILGIAISVVVNKYFFPFNKQQSSD